MARGKTKDRDGIYTRKDRPGWWASWIDASGKRHQRKLEAHTLPQARALLAAERARVEMNQTLGYAQPGPETFSEAAARFLGYQKRRIASTPAKGKISQDEYVRQQGILALHLVPYFGSMKMAAIRRKDVNAYIDHRMGKVSDGSIIKEINVLKRLFSVAVDTWEMIPKNPAHGCEIPEAPKGRVRYLQPEELGKVMQACPSWLRPIVGLAVSTGCRRGELLQVRWDDVDIPGNRILLSHTKNGRPRHTYLNYLSHQVLASMGVHGGQELLFPGVTPAQVSVAFIRACKAAGIEDFSMHDLRHTYASHMRMNGADLHTIQKLLGHSDPRMTDRYAHLSESFLGDAARRLDGVFPDAMNLGKNEPSSCAIVTTALPENIHR